MTEFGEKMVVRFTAGVVVIMVFFAGCSCGTKAERERAVKAGAGNWEADPKTGDVRFVYKVEGKACR